MYQHRKSPQDIVDMLSSPVTIAVSEMVCLKMGKSKLAKLGSLLAPGIKCSFLLMTYNSACVKNEAGNRPCIRPIQEPRAPRLRSSCSKQHTDCLDQSKAAAITGAGKNDSYLAS